MSNHHKRNKKFTATPNINKLTIPLKGMHCKSCEILIGDNLQDLEGVDRVDVSLKTNAVTIYASSMPSREILREAIVDAGYDIGFNAKKPWISRKPRDWAEVGACILILSAFLLILKSMGLLGAGVSTGGNPTSLLVVLAIGLTAGISTCMALIGGLLLGISARHAEKAPLATTMQKFRPHLFFNLGRIASYAFLGGVIGLLGSAFQLKSPMLGLLMIAVGIVMFALGAQLTELFPRLSNGGLTLPAGLSKALGIKEQNDKEYSHKNAALLGAMTFFLPCGFTQAMQLYAMSTGSFLSGALIMGVFALGTAPGLLGVGGLTSIIKGEFAKKFFRFVGVGVMGLAAFNISNGYNLTGFVNPFAGATNLASVTNANVQLENGVQIMRMNQTVSGYLPNSFSVKQGVPVRWVIDSKDSSSCSSSIVSPKLDIQQSLKPGENSIEFTPKETGAIRFSCSMGMYQGVINVVKNTDSASTSASPTTSPAPNPASEPSSSPVSIKSSTTALPNELVLYTTYANSTEIQPNQFTTSVGRPTKIVVTADEAGQGCMSTIMIPGLVNKPQLLTPGNTIMSFTPKQAGSYQLTCAMGIPFGNLTVTL